jgi:simple sugar transport system substrate-binding protein
VIRRVAILAVLALALVVAACGETSTVREPTLYAQGGDEDPGGGLLAEPTPRRGSGLRVTNTRIAFVSHGQASDGFWAIVRRGLEDAARQSGVAVSYRAPDTYDVARMGRLIDEAISARLDGLVVSLPDIRALRAPIRRALKAGIPVVSINSGSDRFRDLGIPVHVGQPEWRAGFESGRRMAGAGVRHGLCVNQETGNEGVDQRCRGFSAGMRRRGGRASQISVDGQDAARAQQQISDAIEQLGVDGVMSLGTSANLPALKAVRAGGFGREVKLATFDLTPEVLEAVRIKRVLFAVDQQPYLQGYTPVMLLAERARHGLFPARGEVIATGPRFITAKDVTDELIELSRRGLR